MGVAYLGPIFGIACTISDKNLFNPGMLKPYMKFIQSYAGSKQQGYMDLHVNCLIARVLSSF